MRSFLLSITPITDFLHLLQLQEYETKRYFKTIKRFWWRRNLQKRGKLVWTKRIKITLAPVLLFCIIIPPLTPIWIGVSNWLFTPYFEWKKRVIQQNAAEKFSEGGEDTKVIMIAGSYGKTTTKNYIYELVKYNYKTQMVPGNINTLTGIANWIVSDFKRGTEVLVAEVDPYYVGEIRRACEIIPPDIAILTNIGDQHLERLGTRQNLKKALMEIFEYTKPGAVKIKGLKTNLDYALEVAKILEIPNDIQVDTVKKLRKPDRRGDIKIINNFEVIDESYNISETTAKFGVDNALKIAKTKKKKLVVITAGIPELGEDNKDANKNLGDYLAKKVDRVILLKSVFCKEILDSRLPPIRRAGRGNDPTSLIASLGASKFILAKDLGEAWRILEEFDPKKYLVLLQPELNDLYY